MCGNSFCGFCISGVDFTRRLWYYSQAVFGRLAQLEEHPLDVRKVAGSSPTLSTKGNPRKSFAFRGFFLRVMVSKETSKQPLEPPFDGCPRGCCYS